MPVTSRNLQVRKFYGAGKKGPNYSYNPVSGRATQTGCGVCVSSTPQPPAPITMTYNTSGTYTYTLPSWNQWTITYEILGGGGGGGAGNFINIPGINQYGFAGNAGLDSILMSSSFTTLLNTIYIVVGDGGNGGFSSGPGQPGINSSISDTPTPTYISTGGSGGTPGLGSGFNTGPFIAAPVSGLPGTGGRGGNTASDGSKGVAGYVTFTATPVV